MGKQVLGLTLFMIILSALLGLGTWQLKRLHWKTNIIDALDAEYAKDPKANQYGFNDLKKIEEETTPIRYGTVSGVFDYDREIFLGPKTEKDEIGYHVITPLKLQDGGFILVKRGWIATSDAEHASLPEKRGQVEISGVLRRPDWNSFTPRNNPDQDVWIRLDPQGIAAAKKIEKISELVVYQGNSHKWYPRNKHKQYAIFWFTMAVIWAAYGLILLRRRK